MSSKGNKKGCVIKEKNVERHGELNKVEKQVVVVIFTKRDNKPELGRESALCVNVKS